jgi:hypothetical protein
MQSKNAILPHFFYKKTIFAENDNYFSFAQIAGRRVLRVLFPLYFLRSGPFPLEKNSLS